jgi:hypothetical protein
MNTENFLRVILPSDGVVIIATQTGRGFRHKGFQSIAEAAAYVLQCDAQGLATYHACAAYKALPHKDESGKYIARTSDNWLKAKSFWCDIDCGAEKSAKGIGYTTQKDGAVALLTWCNKRGLPFPMIVSSGRGIHAYWPLTEPLEPRRWVEHAGILKSLMSKDGLLADPSRTADFASVLRPVGTHNRKDPQNPKDVKVVRECEPVETEAFLAKLKEFVAAGQADMGEVPPWMAEGDKIEVHTEMQASAHDCADKCRQIAIMRDTQGDVSYDHWRGVIGIIKHCVEGIDLAYEWSAKRGETGHANLDVDTRYNTWTSGPTTCAFFQQCNAEGCKDCPYAGKVKTPLVLGRLVPEPAPAVAESTHEDKAEVVQFEIPPLPDGFQWDNGRLVRFVKNKDGNMEAHCFCQSLFYLMDRIRGADGRMSFTARVHLPNGVREFSIEGTMVGSGNSKLWETLGAYEVIMTDAPDAMKNMHAYIKSSVVQMTKTVKVRSTHTHFGWQDDGSFLLGTRLYKSNGEKMEALLSGFADSKRACFPAVRGTVEGYAGQINWMYNREGMEPMQYLVCSMLAAPLVDLCEPMYKGIPCALTGASSGKGKSTAALFALYAYGEADELTIAGKAGATSKSQSALLGAVRNLPVLFDEVTNMKADVLSNLCYSLSNGVEPMRLQSAGGKVGFATRESWRTHTAMTGNTDIATRMASNGNTEAELMRIFEIRVDQYNIPKLDPAAVTAALVEAERNAGAVGDMFIRWLVGHRTAAQQAILAELTKLSGNAALMAEPKYRFYRNHMACTLACAKILTDLGVFKFDLQKLHDFAMDAVAEIFENSKEFTDLPVEETLSRMVSSFTPMIISTPTMLVGENEELYHVQMSQGVVGRAIRGNDLKRDEYDGKLFLSANAITEWCGNHRVDKRVLARGLRLLGVLLDQRAKVTLGKDTTAVTSQCRCWELDINKLENGVEEDGRDE